MINGGSTCSTNELVHAARAAVLLLTIPVVVCDERRVKIEFLRRPSFLPSFLPSFFPFIRWGGCSEEVIMENVLKPFFTYFEN